MIKINKSSQISSSRHKAARQKGAIKAMRKKTLTASKLIKPKKTPEINKKKKKK
jgi:soluble cytochrome b562|tara:strand:- start:1822 stop:1983 length:162 start_codon:yes stop_codon:yes gene_type:complete